MSLIMNIWFTVVHAIRGVQNNLYILTSLNYGINIKSILEVIGDHNVTDSTLPILLRGERDERI